MTKTAPLIWAPLAAIICFYSLSIFNFNYLIAVTLAITLLVTCWWVTEALPIPATSMLPFILFPLFGVLDHKTAASSLGSHVILLLLGAFILSKAVEKSGVHHRIALSMIHLLGGENPKKIVLGFMISAAFLSMWISNTATTLMLLPIALAVIKSTNNKRFAAVLLLGIAYAANIGGMGTPIGTPPNIIFMGIYEQEFGKSIDFLQWMMLTTPIIIITVPLAAFWLTRGLKLDDKLHLPTVNQWSVAEKRVLIIFALTACAWVFRQAPFGGWSALIGNNTIGDSSIAIGAVMVLFLVPDGKKAKLLDWKTASEIPWGMLLLFAGGICIAKAFQSSGLSMLLGDYLTLLSQLPVFLMISLVALAVIFLTEITSNTATTTLLMPILAVAGVAANIEPELLMLPAALGASCAFMLPVATAPNAIVFGTEKFAMKTMAHEGLAMNVLLTIAISVTCYLLLPR